MVQDFWRLVYTALGSDLNKSIVIPLVDQSVHVKGKANTEYTCYTCRIVKLFNKSFYQVQYCLIISIVLKYFTTRHCFPLFDFDYATSEFTGLEKRNVDSFDNYGILYV